MSSNRRGIEELTDATNAEITATRTAAFWKRGAAYRQRSRVLSLDFDPEKLRERLLAWAEAPGELLLNDAVRTSPSIGGDMRRDMKETAIGAPSERSGLVINTGAAQERAPPAESKKKGL